MATAAESSSLGRFLLSGGVSVVGTIADLFWNSDEGRLRAGWRVLVFWITAIVFGLALLRLRDAVPSVLLAEVYGNAAEASTLTDNSSLGLRYHSKVNAPSGSTPMVGVGSSVGIASAKRRA